MIKNLSRYSPYIIAFAAFLWAIDGILRVSLYSLPPTVIVFWEHVLGAIILFPFLIKYKEEIFKLTKKEWGALILLSLFSGALGTIFYTTALQKVQFAEFSVVPLLQQLQPIWAITFAAVLLREKISKKFLTWAGFALVATYLITFRDLSANISLSDNTFMAGVFALLAGAMWGASTSFSKIVLNKVNFMTASVLRFWIVPLVTLPFVFGMGHQTQLLEITQAQWVQLFIITFSTGMLALVIYYYGLRKTPARVSTIAELTFPATAIIIQYFFGNPLSITQIAGIGILAFAIYKVAQYRE